MSVIGFNFTKITVERKKAATGKVNINNNVVITNVTEKKLNFAKDQKGLQFEFGFTSKYDPGLGNINLDGEVIYLESEEAADKILDNWKKNKKVEKDVMTKVLNNVLNKCNIQALILSQTINLPPPIPLPKVKAEVAKK